MKGFSGLRKILWNFKLLLFEVHLQSSLTSEGRAIAYEITTSSLLRKQEFRDCRPPGFRNEAANSCRWIPAFAGMTGMTVLEQSICDYPAFEGEGTF